MYTNRLIVRLVSFPAASHSISQISMVEVGRVGPGMGARMLMMLVP